MSREEFDDVWENSPAKGSELLLLLAIAYFADGTGYASENVATLGGKARMSASSVFRATRKLEEAGLLEVLEHGDGRVSTEYQLLPRVVSLTAQGSQSDDPQADAEGSRVVNLTTLGGQSDDPGSSDCGGRVVNLKTQGSQIDDPQMPESGQSGATADAAVSTRARAHARVGGLVGTTTPPTNPPTPPTTDRAHASASADAPQIDERAVEFMASLNLKRTPRITEQVEIADLFLARIDAGFTVAEIRNSVGGEWGDARDRVRALVWRLKEMPERPLRRPKPAPRPDPAPVAPTEIAKPGDAFHAARAARREGTPAAAQARSKEADAAYRVARRVLDETDQKDRDAVLAMARADLPESSRTDVRAQVIRAVEILGELNLMAYRHRASGD